MTRTYTRLPNGLVRRVNRPENRYSEYIYDSKGLLCGVEYHDGSFEQFCYNKDGQLMEAHNQNSVVRFVRDKVGRIVEEWQDGHLVQSHYNKQGQRIKVTSSLGADLSMDYTDAGFLASMQGKQSDQSWGMQLSYNERGLEIERLLSGDVVCRTEYNKLGLVHRHSVTSGNRRMRQKRYSWDQNDRLMNIVDELNNQNTWFDYDTMGNLTGADYADTERLFRVPDAIGNLYKTADRSDRTYDKGGKLVKAGNVQYLYDCEGNLIQRDVSRGVRWQYAWNANGSLRSVLRPDRLLVSFEYDALGRRTTKVFKDRVTRWVWDGNTPFHEWWYRLEDRPKTITDLAGIKTKDREEPIENLITWVFEEGSFRPTAKLTDRNSYSIITDYLGTPAQMFDVKGKLVWQGELDIYGKLRNFEGVSTTACPFRYQGQYEDAETGLYYNRFRYYSPDEGMYISQDPIGLAGNNPTLYGYVKDVNSWVDWFGLAPKIPTQLPSEGIPVRLKPSAIELQQRADDLQAILPEASQGYKTSAAGYATDTSGNGYVILASSDKHLSPAQRGSLDLANGEIRASGSGHAEVTIANYCRDNNLTLESVAASRPVCQGCQNRLDQDGVEIVSERKVSSSLCKK